MLLRFSSLAFVTVMVAAQASAVMRRVDVADSVYVSAANTLPIAWIQYAGDTTQTVSGVLINDQFLLSAAHCYRSGVHTVKLGGETYSIVNWVANSLYNPNDPLAGFDFSVARLDRRVTNLVPLDVRSNGVGSQALINIFTAGGTGLGNGTNYAFPWSPIPATWANRGMTNRADLDLASYPNIILADFDNPTGTSNTLSFLGSSAASTAREGNLIWGDSGGPVTVTVSGKEQVVGICSGLGDQNGNAIYGDYGDISFFSSVSSAYPWITANAWQTGRVAGKVNLANFIGSPNLRDVTIELRPPGSTTVLESFTMRLAQDNGFSFVTARRGLTDIRFRVPGFCSRVISNVNITSTSPGNLVTLLPNGDPDQSGEVDAVDIDLVISNFGATTTSAVLGDLDGSGEVDAVDIDITIANFGQTGTP